MATPPPAQNGYVGFANIIQVNPAVQTNPSLVRDGAHRRPSMSPSPRPAGYTAIINAC